MPPPTLNSEEPRNATLTGCGRHTEGCRLCRISLVSQRCNLVSDRAGCEKCGRLCSQGRAERSSPPLQLQESVVGGPEDFVSLSHQESITRKGVAASGSGGHLL